MTKQHIPVCRENILKTKIKFTLFIIQCYSDKMTTCRMSLKILSVVTNVKIQ